MEITVAIPKPNSGTPTSSEKIVLTNINVTKINHTVIIIFWDLVFDLRSII